MRQTYTRACNPHPKVNGSTEKAKQKYRSRKCQLWIELTSSKDSFRADISFSCFASQGCLKVIARKDVVRRLLSALDIYVTGHYNHSAHSSVVWEFETHLSFPIYDNKINGFRVGMFQSYNFQDSIVLASRAFHDRFSQMESSMKPSHKWISLYHDKTMFFSSPSSCS